MAKKVDCDLILCD